MRTRISRATAPSLMSRAMQRHQRHPAGQQFTPRPNCAARTARLRDDSACFKPEVRTKMLAGIERTAKAAAAMSDAPAPDIRIADGAKAVINDPAAVGAAEKVLKAA